jgi:hypothetical protein
MSMLITSIKNIKEQSSTDGFMVFCIEQGIDPNNYVEPEFGVCVDKMDLWRYGAGKAALELSASVSTMLNS